MKLDFPPNHNKYKAEQGEASQKTTTTSHCLLCLLGSVGFRTLKNEQKRTPLRAKRARGR